MRKLEERLSLTAENNRSHQSGCKRQSTGAPRLNLACSAGKQEKAGSQDQAEGESEIKNSGEIEAGVDSGFGTEAGGEGSLIFRGNRLAERRSRLRERRFCFVPGLRGPGESGYRFPA